MANGDRADRMCVGIVLSGTTVNQRLAADRRRASAGLRFDAQQIRAGLEIFQLELREDVRRRRPAWRALVDIESAAVNTSLPCRRDQPHGDVDLPRLPRRVVVVHLGVYRQRVADGKIAPARHRARQLFRRQRIGIGRRRLLRGDRRQQQSAHRQVLLAEVRHDQVVEHRAVLPARRLARAETQLIAPGRQRNPRVQPDAVRLHARNGLGLQRQIDLLPHAGARSALVVHAVERHFQCAGRRQRQPGAVDLNRQRHGRFVVAIPEWRRLHRQADPSLLQRAFEHAAKLGRRRVAVRPSRFARAAPRLISLAIFQRLRARRRISATRDHLQPRPLHAHVDLVKPPILRVVRRRVSEHVVAAVAVDDAIERGRERIGVDRREAACFFGQHAQAVLRSSQLVGDRRPACAPPGMPGPVICMKSVPAPTSARGSIV